MLYWDKGKIVYRDKAILIVPEELRDTALEAGYKPLANIHATQL